MVKDYRMCRGIGALHVCIFHLDGKEICCLFVNICSSMLALWYWSVGRLPGADYTNTNIKTAILFPYALVNNKTRSPGFVWYSHIPWCIIVRYSHMPWCIIVRYSHHGCYYIRTSSVVALDTLQSLHQRPACTSHLNWPPRQDGIYCQKQFDINQLYIKHYLYTKARLAFVTRCIAYCFIAAGISPIH